MKLWLLVLGFLVSTAFATTIPEYNYKLTDISLKGLDRQKLFNKMQRSMINLHDSICANRAHLWAYDFKRFYGIDTGKVFIFFTRELWSKEETGYMYHVAPYIADNGQEFVMEASYDDLTRPLTVSEWIENETSGKVKGSECINLSKSDTDLTEYFYDRYNLPSRRSNGKKGARCYIKKVPGYYWFPASIAFHELGLDEEGAPVQFDPKAFDLDDVFAACKDAVSGKMGSLFSGAKQQCRQYLKR
jgi:hypothetical protein